MDATDRALRFTESAAYKVEWLEGAFLMTRAENWRALGGLDEYYFLGIDDIDFCRATSDRGLAVVQCAKVRYIHFGGYTPSRAKFVYAGFRHYYKKFSSPAHRLLAELVLRVGLWLRIAIFGVWYRSHEKSDYRAEMAQLCGN